MSFHLRRTLDDLPEDDEHGYPFTKGRLLVHATTEEALPSILKDGLWPRCDTRCAVWDDNDERTMPYKAKQDDALWERICDCRDSHVYFWDSYQDGVEQGVGTVGWLKTGNPVLLIVDGDGLDAKLDIEINEEANDRDNGEGTAWMVEGKVPSERVLCHCRIDEELIPTVGDLFCHLRHDDCTLSLDPDDLYGTYTDPSNWVCQCRDGLLDRY